MENTSSKPMFSRVDFFRVGIFSREPCVGLALSDIVQR